jgi:zinc transport system substrate-binding protein
MVDLAESKIYFAIGVNLERVWLDKIKAANPDLTVVHTEKNIDKIPMKDHRHHHDGDHRHHDHEGDHKHQDHDGDHQHHDHEGDHKHQDHDAGILDPHVWTSPKRVMKMAPVIRDALIEADPANEADYRAGYEAFMAEVKALDARLKEVLAGREGMKFMVFHPAWGYLAHDYGLVQVPVEIEGKEPKPAQLKELIERARTDGVKVVFVQPQLSTSTAEMVAKAIDGRVMHADPLAEDWAENLERQVAEFKAALH